MRGTAMANTAQTIVFMILGLITFFIISNKLGGLEQATNNVLEKNPTKMKRSIDEQDLEKYKLDYGKWQTVAYYNYAVNHDQLTLSAEQKKQAMDEFKAPLPPFLKKDRAPAAFAKKNGLLDGLSIRDRNLAMLEQDDRMPSDDHESNFDSELMSHEDLAHYKRKSGADITGLTMFKDKIGNPSDPTNSQKSKRGIPSFEMGSGCSARNVTLEIPYLLLRATFGWYVPAPVPTLVNSEERR